MLVTSLVATLSASLASALAVRHHLSINDFKESPITFSFPPGRTGFNAASANTAPCGGMAMSERVKYPLTGGDIAVTQRTAVDNLQIFYYKGDNPTKFHSFESYTKTVTDIGPGHYCTKAPDFSARGFAAGDLGTLLIIYALDNHQDSFYYQCADIELVDSASFVQPSNIVCGNFTSEIKVEGEGGTVHSIAHPTTGAAAGYTAAAGKPSNEESSSGLNAAQGGGIGAGVTLAVVALALAALYAVGRVHFGKRNAAVSLDDSSSTASVMKQRA